MPGEDSIFANLQEGRRRFLALVDDVRPELHRYCARMTGSITDGEDVVQDTLAAGDLASELRACVTRRAQRRAASSPGTIAIRQQSDASGPLQR